MSVLDGVPAQAWLAYWRFWSRYHRYSVTGLEHLEGGAKLVAGYHGRPLAYDMCMLTVAIHDRFGYMPHGIVHRGTTLVPALKWFTEQLGFLVADGPEMAAAVARGEHVVVTPGGGQEGMRDFRQRYRVAWGDRLGYVRLAVKYGLPIVPVAAAGADDTYVGLNDAEAFGRRIGVSRDWAWLLWLGAGPLGPYPFSPPFPVRLTQFVGAPIPVDAEGPVRLDDVGSLRRLHRRVTGEVQALLDRGRHRASLW